ncbi:hypothetical protein ACPDHN_16275 [Myroides odoratimimus]|uniref:hypothetical protein n=1 Tax=Myroides odoratimimus TaxID=76832 RepID=UPI003D2F52EC
MKNLKEHKQKIIIITCLLLLGLLASCHKDKYAFYDGYIDGYVDGTYCASIEHVDLWTGASSIYYSDVVVEGQHIIKIQWPNHSNLNESNVVTYDISHGQCTFTTEREYKYTITLISEGKECKEKLEVKMDSELNVINTICQDCRSINYTLDDYCYSCIEG